MARKKKEREEPEGVVEDAPVDSKRRRLRSSSSSNDSKAVLNSQEPELPISSKAAMPAAAAAVETTTTKQKPSAPKPLDPALIAEIRKIFKEKTSAMQDILDETATQGRRDSQNGKTANVAAAAVNGSNFANANAEEARRRRQEMARQLRITEAVNGLMNRPSMLPSANGIGYSDFMQFVSDTTTKNQPTPPEQQQQPSSSTTTDNGNGNRGVCELIGNAKQRLDDGHPELVISFCSNPLFYENDTVDGWGGVDYEEDDSKKKGNDSEDRRSRSCGVKLCFDVIELITHIETFQASHRATKSSKKHIKIPNPAYPVMVAKHGQKWVDDHGLVVYLSKHIVTMVEMHYNMLGYENDLVKLRERLQKTNTEKPEGGAHLTDEMLNIIAPSSLPSSGSDQVLASSESEKAVNQLLIDSIVNPVLIAAIQDNATEQNTNPPSDTRDQTTMSKFLNKAYMFGRGVARVAWAPFKFAAWAIGWLLSSYVGRYLSVMLARMIRFGICAYKKLGPDGLISAFKDLVRYFGNEQPIVIFIAEIGACFLKIVAPMFTGGVVTSGLAAVNFLPCLYKAAGFLLGPMKNIFTDIFKTLAGWSAWATGLMVNMLMSSKDKNKKKEPSPFDDAIKSMQGEAERALIEDAVRKSYHCVKGTNCAFYPGTDNTSYWPQWRDTNTKVEQTANTTAAQKEEAMQRRSAALFLEAKQQRHEENSRIVFSEVFGLNFSANVVGALLLSLVKNYTFLVKCTTMVFGSVAVLRALAISGEMQTELTGLLAMLQWIVDSKTTGVSYAAESIMNWMNVFQKYSFIGLLLMMSKFIPLDADYDLTEDDGAKSTTTATTSATVIDARDKRIASDYDKVVDAFKGFDKVISRPKFATLMALGYRIPHAVMELGTDVTMTVVGGAGAAKYGLDSAITMFNSGQAEVAFNALTAMSATGGLATAVAAVATGAKYVVQTDGPVDKVNQIMTRVKPKRYAFGTRVERFKKLGTTAIKLIWRFITWALELLGALMTLIENKSNVKIHGIEAGKIVKSFGTLYVLLSSSGLLCAFMGWLQGSGASVANGLLEMGGFTYKVDESPAFADICCNLGDIMGMKKSRLDDEGWKNYGEGLKTAPREGRRPTNDYDLYEDSKSSARYIFKEYIA